MTSPVDSTTHRQRPEAIIAAELRAATAACDAALGAALARGLTGDDADRLRRAFDEAEGLERSLARELGQVRGF